MQKKFPPVIFTFLIYCLGAKAQSAEAFDQEKALKTVKAFDLKFAGDYRKGDSVALAAHYTKDGDFAGKKGADILALWGKLIRRSIQDSTRNIFFTTISVMGDSTYIIDYGSFETKDDHGKVNRKGKFLVVLKQEDGEWKLFHDLGI